MKQYKVKKSINSNPSEGGGGCIPPYRVLDGYIQYLVPQQNLKGFFIFFHFQKQNRYSDSPHKNQQGCEVEFLKKLLYLLRKVVLSASLLCKKNTLSIINLVAVVVDISTTTDPINIILCGMMYHTGDRSPASSKSVSGIISARNMKKTTHFLLLQQQKKSFRPQTTINLQDSNDKNADYYISLCV